MRYRVFLILAPILAFCAHSGAQTDEPMMVKSQSGVALGTPFDRSMCVTEGIALGGYDVVSYRQEDGPVPGSEDFSLQHGGSIYLFASQSNADAFRENPDRYLPHYEGFCAVTLALGRVTCPEYRNFKIEDDRLLLFEVTGFTNGRTLWNTNPEDFRQKADANFEKLNSQE